MPGEDSYTLKEAGQAIANEEDCAHFLMICRLDNGSG